MGNGSLQRRALATAFVIASAFACGHGGNGGPLGISAITEADSGVFASEGGASARLIDGGIDVSAPVQLEGILATSLARYGLPALGALVLKGNVVVAEGATGIRKVGDGTAVTRGDLFALGEDVQAMTATLAAILVEDGKLSFASTLGAVLPDVPMHASYTNVTLEALLAQQGGAPAQIPDDVVLAARGSSGAQALRDAAVRSLLASGSTIPSGTFQESDASFLLVTAMLERAASASWESLVETRLFLPLGMKTCASVTSDVGPAPKVPWGHLVLGDGLSPVAPGSSNEPPTAFAPAQGLRCSLEDWARFAALHLAGARGEATTLLHPPSFATLQAPQDITHALGWNAVSRTWAGASLALNYQSRDLGSYALIWILPDKDAAILVVVNQNDIGAEKAADDVVSTLVGQFLTDGH